MELAFFSALMIGLLGSTHCVGMCGGIVGSLNIGSSQAHSKSRRGQVTYHLTYNSGRILSYMVIGALAGFVGAQASRFSADILLPAGGMIAGLFMIVLGLYLAGWWNGIQVLERAGTYIWKRIEPLARRVMPPKDRKQVFALGLVWGWLPCGLVYAALALALVSASPLLGAWIMLGFGLGTLPMLLAMGSIAGQLSKISRHSFVRGTIGTLMILYGAYLCFTALNPQGHHHDSRSHAMTSNCTTVDSGACKQA